jgi:septal ring factor EnvC (AmiA/AmiB activator)
MMNIKKDKTMIIRLFYAFVFFLVATPFSLAQENEVKNDSMVKVKQAEMEVKAMQEKIDQAEKEAKKAQKDAKKAEKAQKKLEKEAKKLADLKDDVSDKKKEIAKGERKINKLQEDMEVDKIKGRLSPNDIDKINKKIEKERLYLVREKEKLRKLERELQKN